jgi:hypothetical protein
MKRNESILSEAENPALSKGEGSQNSQRSRRSALASDYETPIQKSFGASKS